MKKMFRLKLSNDDMRSMIEHMLNNNAFLLDVLVKHMPSLNEDQFVHYYYEYFKKNPEACQTTTLITGMFYPNRKEFPMAYKFKRKGGLNIIPGEALCHFLMDNTARFAENFFAVLENRMPAEEIDFILNEDKTN